jgi:hypothetical protein
MLIGKILHEPYFNLHHTPEIKCCWRTRFQESLIKEHTNQREGEATILPPINLEAKRTFSLQNMSYFN